MAKVYQYSQFKILREIKDLQNFVQKKYQDAKSSEFMWFDHYSVSHARLRIEQLKTELEKMDNDTPLSETESN